MKKRKIILGLMATGFAFATVVAVNYNNKNEAGSSFDISNNINLYQNKLEKKDLKSLWENNNQPFNNFSLGFDLKEALGSDFWCDWLGDVDSSEYENDFIYDEFDFWNGNTAVKIINDTEGNVFAVATMETVEYLHKDDVDVRQKYNLDEFRTQGLEDLWSSFHNLPVRFNLYISDFAGKEITITEQNYANYILNSQKDLSFFVSGFLGYDNGIGSIGYTNEQLGLYVNEDVIELNKPVSLNLDYTNPMNDLLLYWALNVGYESIDNDYPSINGDATYFFSVEQAKDFDYIKSTITAYDETEGDITNKLVFTNTDNYSLDNLRPGTYNFSASVSDEAGHSVSKNFSIVISDVTPPMISATNRDVSYSTCLSQNDIKELFTYSDNYTSKENIIFEIVSDNYTQNFNKVGTYNIVARVTDAAENYKEATATINVIDNIAPIIAAANSYQISTITSKTLTLDKLVATLGIQANDVIEGNVTVTLTDLDDYSNNLGKVGSYTIRVTAKDSKNNTATTDFELNVVDFDYPVISVNSPYCIIVQEGENITTELIKNILISTGQLSAQDAQNVQIESQALQMSYLSPGSYEVKLSYSGNREDTILLDVKEDVSNNTVDNASEVKKTIKEQFNSAVDNLAAISQWNWMNWTMLVLGMFFIILIVLGIKKLIRK